MKNSPQTVSSYLWGDCSQLAVVFIHLIDSCAVSPLIIELKLIWCNYVCIFAQILHIGDSLNENKYRYR